MPRLGSSKFLRLGDFLFCAILQRPRQLDSAHGGTPLSPPIGIAMDPSR